MYLITNMGPFHLQHPTCSFLSTSALSFSFLFMQTVLTLAKNPGWLLTQHPYKKRVKCMYLKFFNKLKLYTLSQGPSPLFWANILFLTYCNYGKKQTVKSCMALSVLKGAWHTFLTLKGKKKNVSTQILTLWNTTRNISSMTLGANRHSQRKIQDLTVHDSVSVKSERQQKKGARIVQVSTIITSLLTAGRKKPGKRSIILEVFFWQPGHVQKERAQFFKEWNCRKGNWRTLRLWRDLSCFHH